MNKQTKNFDEQLIIRVSSQTKDYLAATARSYGLKTTQLGRHLIERQLPTIQKNKFYEFTP